MGLDITGAPTPPMRRVETPEHERHQRLWFRLSQKISCSIMDRVLQERPLEELLEQDPVKDRFTDKCLRAKAQESAKVAAYVALGILEGLEDVECWSDEQMYGGDA